MDTKIATSQTVLTLEQGIERIETLKDLWLNKKINLENLPNKTKEILLQISNQTVIYELKQYVENKILLDSNIESSTEIIANTSFTFIPLVMSLFSTALASGDDKNRISLVFAIVSLMLSIGVVLIAFPILKKHVGKYPKEKSFYQIILNSLQ